MCWMDFIIIILFILNLTVLCATVETILDACFNWYLGKIACLVMLVIGYICGLAWQNSGFSFCNNITQPDVMQCEPEGNAGTKKEKVVL